MKKFMRVAKSGRFAVAGMLFALSVAGATAMSVNSSNTASAESCDPVNIVRCGLDQRSLQSDISSFRADYQNPRAAGHADLKAVYRWAGATDASVNGMNTSNTKLGSLSRDGTIKVGGQVVGTQAAVAARFGAGQAGFHKIPNTDNVYWRLTTTSFAQASAPVIVHFTSEGAADFAVMTGCGNAVKFPPKPPKPQPKPQLTCVNLSGSEVGNTRKFNFRAKANGKDTTITKYVFDYGDKKSQTVRTSSQSATASHIYGAGTSVKARVTVFSSDFRDGKTSGDCTFQVKAPSPKPSLTCSGLTYSEKGLKYAFTASATATNTTITSYAFHFSDQRQPTIVNTSANHASTTHTFAKNNTQYTVYVIVKSAKLTTAQTLKCTKTFKTPGPNECKPGVPNGDKRCTECKPGIPEGSPDCTPTPLPPTTPSSGSGSLSATGSGTAALFGIFGASVIAGTIGHRLLMRHKYGL